MQLSHPPELEFTPPAGGRVLRFVGDTIEVRLLSRSLGAKGSTAFLRTTLGRAGAQRAEIVRAAHSVRSSDAGHWHDLPMASDGAGAWVVQVPLAETGFFRAKPFLVDEQGRQHWPPGEDLGVCVHPNAYRTFNTVYCAFVRLFGASKSETQLRVQEEEETYLELERRGYAVLPPSGKLRDLTREVPHIIDRLGFRIIQLLPVNPTPTTFARFGRFGSPYAGQDLTAIDPALVELDHRTTGVEQFMELADSVHGHGGRLFLDLVINHTGWGSRLFEEHPEWFARDAEGRFLSPGAWGTIWEDLVELKPESVELWEELALAFLTWCRRGVDGFRCDAGYKVPARVWRYIVARVRGEFPDTLFLLEGLGGAWHDTEALLTDGGMQWAYSELFQEFSGPQVSRYLNHALDMSRRVGLLVHYSETHDNHRLAAKGRAWSLMRNRLCALTSPNGGYAITCGVEWLASEKIKVHQNSGMRWNSGDNLVGEIAALNRLLANHPCFFDGAHLERLSEPDAPVYVLLRRSANQRQSVLIVVNPLEQGPQPARWSQPEPGPGPAPAFDFRGWRDLLGQQSPEITLESDGTFSGVILEASAYCLAPPGEEEFVQGSAYREFQARQAWAIQRLNEVSPISGLSSAQCVDLSDTVNADPAGFLGFCACLMGSEHLQNLDVNRGHEPSRLLSRPSATLPSIRDGGEGWGGAGRRFMERAVIGSPIDWCKEVTEFRSRGAYRSVIEWTSGDERRTTMVPEGHWLLVRMPHEFSVSVEAEGSGPVFRLDVCPVGTDWIAALAPGKIAGGARLVIRTFEKPPVSGGAALVFLGGTLGPVETGGAVTFGGGDKLGCGRDRTPCQSPGALLGSGVNLPPPESVVLLTNGRGGMSRVRVDWGRIESKYDCLLGANLHATVPVDRHVFAKRVRLWCNANRFLAPMDIHNLIGFEGGQVPCWRFRVAAGADAGVEVEVELRMDWLTNAVRVVLRRPRLEETAHFAVVITARVDLEDRNFHCETKRNGGSDLHFRRHVHELESGAGFRFAPAADRVLTVSSSLGRYHESGEWCEGITHAVEASRGQEAWGDAFSPGWFEIPLESGATAELLVSAEMGQVESNVAAGGGASDPVLDSLRGGGLVQRLVRAADQFLVRRGAGHSVIAGYPWFLDWGRDSLIAARGLIACGRIDEVLSLVRTFARFEVGGTLPNCIQGEDASNRDTSDAPLWLGVVVEELAKACAERNAVDVYSLVVDDQGRCVADVLESIALGYLAGTSNGIRVDSESALVWSPSHFTWMDTNHPAGTPREGYPVEIQALWVRLLRQLARVRSGQDSGRWARLVSTATHSIEKYFWMEKRGWYADGLRASQGVSAGQALVDDALRSNAVFLVSLGVVTGEPGGLDRARSTVLAVARHLAVPGALRSLAPLPVELPLPIRGAFGHLLNDPIRPYWGRYEGDEDTRRKPAYHNGTAWCWTFPSFCEAIVVAWPDDAAARVAARSYLDSLSLLLDRGCLGQLPEILDGDTPHAERGCDAQAWSVTEAVRVLRLLET